MLSILETMQSLLHAVQSFLHMSTLLHIQPAPVGGRHIADKNIALSTEKCLLCAMTKFLKQEKWERSGNTG